MQRCSEQMVLLAKAYSILDAALRPYVFDQALTNTEPSQELEKGLKKKSSYEGLDWGTQLGVEVINCLISCSGIGDQVVTKDMS